MRTFCLAVIAIFAVSGCGGSFVVHERSDQPIRKIALLSVPPTGDYFVEQITPNVLDRAPVNFINANHLFQRERFDLRDYLEGVIVTEFAKKGIAVAVIPIHRDGPRKLFENFETIDAQLRDFDAVLEVLPSTPGYHFGPYGERSMGRLRPMLGMMIQMQSVRPRKVLCRDRFAYSFDVRTPEDEKYIFEDMKTLVGTPAFAVAGLQHASRSLVKHFVSVCAL